MLSPHMRNLGYLLSVARRTAYAGLAMALRQSCVDHGKPYVITPPQWGVLATLAETDGLPPGKLSQVLTSDAPTITGVLSRLEHSGLVRRHHDDVDRRVVKVYLTDEGRAAMAFLPAVVQAHLRHLTAGLSASDQRQLTAGLEHLIANAMRLLPGAAHAQPSPCLPAANAHQPEGDV